MREAIVRQGIDQVFRSVMAAAMGSLGKVAVKGYDLSRGKLWEHSVAVAIGFEAALSNQGNVAVAIGTEAGNNLQGQLAVAVGAFAAVNNRSDFAVALGNSAGRTSVTRITAAAITAMMVDLMSFVVVGSSA